MRKLFDRLNQGERRAKPIGLTLVSLSFVTTAMLSACNAPVSAAEDPSVEELAATAAAQTVVAQLTQIALQATPTLFPVVDTPVPTVAPTSTPLPTSTVAASPTATSIPCDWAQFVGDVTVKDGSVFSPGAVFTKTWRLKNIGTCTWTADYTLTFVKGDRMSGSKSVDLGESVRPGETVDLSVELTAPDDEDDYIGYWALSNLSGQVFGVGGGAGGAFWVQIEVKKPRKQVYNFVDNYCDADWRSGAGELACPGAVDDSEGFVISLDNPVMEGGRVENEVGLWTEPQWVDDGWIKGTYPAFKVKAGDQFRTIVSCLDEAPKCNVRFRLDYRIGDGSVETLGQWDEKSEGGFTTVKLDLSKLAGKEVKFILTVLARQTFADDSALWLQPSIWR